MKAKSADEFYSMMSVLSIRMFDQNVIDENELIQKIYSYGPFPLKGLEELREKFTFNITPFQNITSSNSTDTHSSKNKEGLSHLKLNFDSDQDRNADDLFDFNKANLPASSTRNNSSHRLASSNAFEMSPYGGVNDLSFRKVCDADSEHLAYEDDEVEDLAKMISCFGLLMSGRQINNAILPAKSPASMTDQASSRNDIMMTAAAAASAFGSVKLSKKLSNSEKKNSEKNAQKDKTG